MFDLCKKLCDYDYNVDAKCGLHIHLDSKDYKDNSFAIKTLMQFYIVFEDVILAMLPKSRRTNNYCKALKTAFHLSEIQDTDGMDDLESLWYRQTDKNEIKQYKTYKHGSRYYGVNFHSLFANGHIEIRFHSGTIDSQKILHWINLHSTIMDKIVNSDVQYSFFVGAITTLSLSEKINKFFSLLSLPEKQKDYLIARIQKFNVGLLQSENEFIPSSEAITEIKSDNQTTICVE